MSKPLPGTIDTISENPLPLQPLVFESQMLRAALEKQVSEKLRTAYRDLCSLTKEIPQSISGKSAQEICEEKQQILAMLEESSNNFFSKMRRRIANPGPQKAEPVRAYSGPGMGESD